FFAVAVRILFGESGSGSREPSKAAAGVLGWPGGPVIVAIAGAALIAISAFQVYDAFRGRFADDNKLREMGPLASGTFMVLGHVGLVARGLVFMIVGYFVVKTALDYSPHEAVGLDGA